MRGIFFDNHLWRRQSFAVGRALKWDAHNFLVLFLDFRQISDVGNRCTLGYYVTYASDSVQEFYFTH